MNLLTLTLTLTLATSALASPTRNCAFTLDCANATMTIDARDCSATEIATFALSCPDPQPGVMEICIVDLDGTSRCGLYPTAGLLPVVAPVPPPRPCPDVRHCRKCGRRPGHKLTCRGCTVISAED